MNISWKENCKMNIICNNCVGSRIYELTKTVYNNPFMWSLLDYESFKNLILNFDKINFNQIEIFKTNLEEKFDVFKDSYYLNVDSSKLIIHYPHYKYDNNENNVIKKGTDVFYSKIKDYVIEKYKTRLDRMKNCDVDFFVLSKSQIMSCDDILRLLEIKTDKKIFAILPDTTEIKKKYSDNVKILLYDSSIKNTTQEARLLIDNYKDFFSNK